MSEEELKAIAKCDTRRVAMNRDTMALYLNLVVRLAKEIDDDDVASQVERILAIVKASGNNCSLDAEESPVVKPAFAKRRRTLSRASI
jgi:hypothetical protein